MGNKVRCVHIRQNIPSLPTHGAVLPLTGPVLFLRFASAFTKVYASVFLCMATLSCEYVFVGLCLSLPKTRLSAAQSRQGKEGGRGKKAAGKRSRGKKQGKEGGRGKKAAGKRSREKKAAGERRRQGKEAGERSRGKKAAGERRRQGKEAGERRRQGKEGGREKKQGKEAGERRRQGKEGGREKKQGKEGGRGKKQGKEGGRGKKQGKEGGRGKKRQENSNHLEDVPAAALVPTYFRTINRWGRTAC